MRYTKPCIIATLTALSTIQSMKGSVPGDEQDESQLTIGPAYQSEE